MMLPPVTTAAAVLAARPPSVAKDTPVEFSAVDRYEGPPLAAGESSLTIRMTLQPSDRTLTDPETEEYRQALVDCLRNELGLRIRT